MNTTQIFKAYSGRIGCMCGCKGTYSYISQDAAAVEQTARGEAPHDVNVDADSVRAIASKVLAHPAVQFQGNQAFVETKDTIDMVFFA